MINIQTFRCTDYLENSYLIYDQAGVAAFVDPGFYHENELAALNAYVEGLRLYPQMILLTHVHIDHVLGCSYLMSKYNIPVYLHQKDISSLKKMSQYAQSLNYSIQDVKGECRLIEENDLITIGSVVLKVFHMPGHTPGSVSYLSPNDNIMFSGDIIYHNEIGRTDLPGGDPDMLSKSIAKLFSMDPSIKLLPGHGPETSIGYEHKFNLKAVDIKKETLANV